MTRRRWLTLTGAVGITLILAFPLQDVIRKTIILPLAYLWWALGVLYQSFPQVVIWILLVILIAFTLLGSLATNKGRTPREESMAQPSLGQVEEFAIILEKARGGMYNKWLVANRLGKLARDFLIQRGDRASIRDHSPLTGRDWHPSEPVDAYLDTGLRGSFADFPNPRWRFVRPEPTPLDIEVDDVVEFLEGKMKTN